MSAEANWPARLSSLRSVLPVRIKEPVRNRLHSGLERRREQCWRVGQDPFDGSGQHVAVVPGQLEAAADYRAWSPAQPMKNSAVASGWQGLGSSPAQKRQSQTASHEGAVSGASPLTALAGFESVRSESGPRTRLLGTDQFGSSIAPQQGSQEPSFAPFVHAKEVGRFSAFFR
jgi:hypothetical protein